MMKKKKSIKKTKLKLKKKDSAGTKLIIHKQPAKEPAKITPHPTAGPKVTDFEEKLNRVLETPQEPGKRGPGRPRKELQAEPEFELDEHTIAQGLKMPFDLWAINQKLKDLRISDQEAQTIAVPVKKLLDYYFPGAPVIVLTWAGLIITIYTVFTPRLKLIANIKKQKKSPSSASTDQTDRGQGGPDQSVLKNNIKPGSKIKFPEKIEPIKI